MKVHQFRRKLCRCVLVLATICAAPRITSAADHYVCSAATGTGDGTSWTNAFTGKPSTFVRGDTYWVAAGGYGQWTLNTADNGSIITIQAATDTAHGSSSTGWTNGGTGSCHQGQATFTATSSLGAFDITTGHWTINGAYRGASWTDTASYGFFVDGTSNGVGYSGNTSALYVHGSGETDNVRFDYIWVKGSGVGGSPDFDVWFHCTSSGQNNDYVGHSLLDISGADTIRLSGVQNATLEYTWLRNNYSNGGHSQTVTVNEGGSPGNGCGSANSSVTIRYNYIENSQGAGNINTPCGCNNPGFSGGNFDIYGNVFFVNTAETNGQGSIGAWNDVILFEGAAIDEPMHIYNNDIVGLPNNNSANLLGLVNGASIGSGGSITVENNLWYSNNGTQAQAYTSSGVTWDYQSYFNQGMVTDSSAHIQCSGGPPTCGGGNPFVDVVINSAGHDNFHLATDTAAWTPLPPPYNVDMDGVVRTSSRGAFQFTSGTSTAPSPPSGLSVAVQ